MRYFAALKNTTRMYLDGSGGRHQNLTADCYGWSNTGQIPPFIIYMNDLDKFYHDSHNQDTQNFFLLAVSWNNAVNATNEQVIGNVLYKDNRRIPQKMLS